MTEGTEELRQEELAEVEGELLPERDAMSAITTGLEEPLPVPIVPDNGNEPLRGGEPG